MSNMIETIVAGMEWAARSGVTEYAFAVDGHRIQITRATGAPAAAPVPAAPAPAATAISDAVSAPIAGLCHLGSEDGGAPFVKPGAKVMQGQTLCIIEAMKMMTAIPSPISGTVREIIVSDGDTVAVGAPLIRIA